LEAYQQGVFPNIDELSALEDQTVHADRWLWSLLSVTGGYLVIVIATRQVRRYRWDGQRQRRRAAPQRARQRLRQAAEEVERGGVRRAADQISAALIGFIADWSAHEETGMTSRDAGRLLREHSDDEALIVRIEQLLELCDSARYGAAADSMREIDRQASSVLEALITDLKGPGRTSAKQSVAGSSGNGERNG
jgi:hypothetical protein